MATKVLKYWRKTQCSCWQSGFFCIGCSTEPLLTHCSKLPVSHTASPPEQENVNNWRHQQLVEIWQTHQVMLTLLPCCRCYNHSLSVDVSATAAEGTGKQNLTKNRWSVVYFIWTLIKCPILVWALSASQQQFTFYFLLPCKPTAI